MRKLLFFAIIIASVAFVQQTNAQVSQTYDFSATVLKFIAINPGNANFAVDPVGNWNHEVVDPATPNAEVLPGWPDWKAKLADNAYSNCPFTITFTGTGGGVNLPILSRQEQNGNGYDRLQTYIVIRNEINGVWGAYGAGHERHDMKFMSDPEGAATGNYVTGQTVTFNETPHNGEIQTEFFMSAALPHKTPDFGSPNTWNQSADAGLYTCQIVATYAAI